MPGRLVVPHGEPFTIAVRLRPGSAWRPPRESPGSASKPRRGPAREGPVRVRAAGTDRRRAGSRSRSATAQRRLRIEPTLRPELTSVVADVTLPDYLGRPRPERKDVRGGAISLVKGSRAQFAATASRTLATAQVDGLPRTPAGATVTSPSALVDGPLTVEFRWRDTFGLTGKEPFTLAINGRDDEPPSPGLRGPAPAEGRARLGAAQLQGQGPGRFRGQARRPRVARDREPARHRAGPGERVLAAGAIDQDTLEAAGTFSAKSLDIEPQPIRLRVFAEDYLPGRPRVYSPPYTFFVLNAEQHALWVTEQLSKWHRHSLEVRDREMLLHETNKQLRALSDR